MKSAYDFPFKFDSFHISFRSLDSVLNNEHWGAVVRAVGSHQRDPGSIPRLGVEFAGSLLCSERFFLRVLRFSSLLKN